MSKYRKTIREALEEIYVNEAQSHTVRYTDPLNKKKFAVPFKTHDAAEKKMAQLKKDGVKDIKITMDTLKPNVSFKEDLGPETDLDRLFKKYPKWKKTSGGMYPRYNHPEKGEIYVDRYGMWLHSDKKGKTIAARSPRYPKTNIKIADYLKTIKEDNDNEDQDKSCYCTPGRSRWNQPLRLATLALGQSLGASTAWAVVITS